MRVRILRDFFASDKSYHAGELVEVDPSKARNWIAAGRAMQDKSLDGAKETKVSPPGTTIMREGFVTETGILPGEGAIWP